MGLLLPAVLPGRPGFRGGLRLGPDGLAQQPHQDIAWDFVRFVTTNPTIAAKWNIASGTIPAMPVVAESPEIAAAMPWIPRALKLLPYGQYLGNMPDRDLVLYEILYPHILNVLQGVEEIDPALEAIETEANSTFQ